MTVNCGTPVGLGGLFFDTDITPTTPGKTRYSGIEWRVDGDEAVALIAAGEKVKVSGVSSGVFEVVRDA